MSYKCKRERLEKIIQNIPAGSTFTSQDIADNWKGWKSLTAREIGGILPSIKSVKNITNRSFGMNTWIKLRGVE